MIPFIITFCKLLYDQTYSKLGPIVAVVILRTNGETEEKAMDMTPKTDKVREELKGAVTFLGQYEMLEVVIVMRADQDSEELPINTHKMQPPFHQAEVRGDMILMRSNEEGFPIDFTLKEYKDFQALKIEEWLPNGK